MSYLIMKTASNATPESFQLTSTIDKPRIYVNGSYIPLTTNSGEDGNLKLKIVKNDTTYYAMRTSTSSFSQSASASTTFNTTADSPDGLESVTNLTRVSTSNTIYQTRASTSATLTRASTSATLTRASTSATLTRASTYETLTRASTWYTYTRASTYYTYTRESVYSTDPAVVEYTLSTLSQYISWIYNPGNVYEQTYTSVNSITMTITRTECHNTNQTNCWFPEQRFTMYQYGTNRYRDGSLHYTTILKTRWDGLLYLYAERIPGDQYVSGQSSFTMWNALNNRVTTGTIYYTRASEYDYATRESIYGYETRESVYGYNTRQSVSGYATRESVSGYATRESVSGYGTRVSTSNTVYETRESISGYSGVSTSSSSSSESASGTCWR